MDFKESPVHFTLEILSKKWTVDILEQLLSGRKRYSDLLETNELMSGKVLSERLKELYKLGIIEKIVTNIMPVRAKYQLTERGKFLSKILFEMAIFSSIFYPNEIFDKGETVKEEKIIDLFGNLYKIDELEINLIKKRHRDI